MNGTTMENFLVRTAIHLIIRQISQRKPRLKTTLNEMNLRNQQNFFSPRYAVRIMRKTREPCNKATSQELLSRGGDKEIPLGIRRPPFSLRKFYYASVKSSLARRMSER